MSITRINTHKKARGFTLLEVIVSMGIGTILIGGTLSMFVNNTNASNEVLRLTHLNHEMRTVLEIMASDIRKAGFWSNAVTAGKNDANPFGVSKVSADKKCILYSYDSNNGNNTVDTAEKYGFRLNGNDVESRLNGNNCATTSAWDTLSDSTQVEITSLKFTSTVKCTNISTSPIEDCSINEAGTLVTGAVNPSAKDVLVKMQSIKISLSGKLVTDNNVRLQLTDTITLKNDTVKLAP